MIHWGYQIYWKDMIQDCFFLFAYDMSVGTEICLEDVLMK
jgi:hypothetical protein